VNVISSKGLIAYWVHNISLELRMHKSCANLLEQWWPDASRQFEGNLLRLERDVEGLLVCLDIRVSLANNVTKTVCPVPFLAEHDNNFRVCELARVAPLHSKFESTVMPPASSTPLEQLVDLVPKIS